MNTYSYSFFINQFQVAKQQATTFFEGLDDEVALRKPAEDVWSILECYSHVNQYNGIYLRQIRKGLDRTDAPQSFEKDIYPPGWLWQKIIRRLEPPYRLKIPTLNPFQPESDTNLDKEAVLEKFVALQQYYVEALRSAENRNLELDLIKVSNPIFNFINMTLSECFAVVDAHQRRHMWQAEQVLQRLVEAG